MYVCVIIHLFLLIFWLTLRLSFSDNTFIIQHTYTHTHTTFCNISNRHRERETAHTQGNEDAISSTQCNKGRSGRVREVINKSSHLWLCSWPAHAHNKIQEPIERKGDSPPLSRLLISLSQTRIPITHSFTYSPHSIVYYHTHMRLSIAIP